MASDMREFFAYYAGKSTEPKSDKLICASEIYRQTATSPTALMRIAAGTLPENVAVVDSYLVGEVDANASLRRGKRKSNFSSSIDLVDDNGNSALHYALMNIGMVSPEIAARKTMIAKRLMEYGADILLENNLGKTPLDYVQESVALLYGLPFASRNVPPEKGIASNL